MYRSKKEFQKYHGKKEYKELERKLRQSNRQMAFTGEEKKEMLSDMIHYIHENDYVLYHDFMDDIAVNNVTWFNMLAFDGKAKRFLLEFVKARVQGEATWSYTIDENCYHTEPIIERNCNSCEFNMGGICAGSGTRPDTGADLYGQPINEIKSLFPDGCENYKVAFKMAMIIEERAEMGK